MSHIWRCNVKFVILIAWRVEQPTSPDTCPCTAVTSPVRNIVPVFIIFEPTNFRIIPYIQGLFTVWAKWQGSVGARRVLMKGQAAKISSFKLKSTEIQANLCNTALLVSPSRQRREGGGISLWVRGRRCRTILVTRPRCPITSLFYWEYAPRGQPAYGTHVRFGNIMAQSLVPSPSPVLPSWRLHPRALRGLAP